MIFFLANCVRLCYFIYELVNTRVSLVLRKHPWNPDALTIQPAISSTQNHATAVYLKNTITEQIMKKTSLTAIFTAVLLFVQSTSALTLPELRQPNLIGWRASFPSSSALNLANGNYSDGWLTQNTAILLDNTLVIPDKGVGTVSNNYFIRTRQTMRVGSVYFKAKYSGSGNDGVISVEMSPNNSSNPTSPHNVIQQVSVSPGTSWTQYRIENVNIVSPTYIRIRQVQGAANGGNDIFIKDIVITDIQPEVKVTGVPVIVNSKSNADYDPGYPSQYDDITFKISVENVHASAPATDIAPKLIWRHVAVNNNSWHNTAMLAMAGTTQGEIGDYTVTLAKLPPWGFQYYYRIDFAGADIDGYGGTKISNATLLPHYPTANTYASEHDKNTSDFELWLSGTEDLGFAPGPSNTKYFKMSRSPAYYPEIDKVPNMTTDLLPLPAYYGTRAIISHLYNYSVPVWPPVSINTGSDSVPRENVFTYPAFNVRRFRSRHDTMVTRFADESGNGLSLESPSTMLLVGDYTWMAIPRITNEVDVAASVIGTHRHDPGEDFYEYSPRMWGQIGQDETARNPPMSGFTSDAGIYEEEPIRINLFHDGFFMLRFCETNGYYEIRRAAWQDYNAWQANNTEFTRSFGLYTTENYESDMTGCDETTMDTANIQSFEYEFTEDMRPPINGPYYTEPAVNIPSSRYVGGLIVNRGAVIQERTPIAFSGFGDPDTYNKAVRLPASSAGSGYIETTKDVATKGRDTLNLQLRAASSGDHPAIYQNGYAFDNYTVTANIQIPQNKMSPANPYVSLYAYYRDARNYMEARITQVVEFTPGPTTTIRPRLRIDLFQMKDGVLAGSNTPVIWPTGGGETLLDNAANQPLVVVLKLSNSGNGFDVSLTVNTVTVSGTSVATINRSGLSVSPSVVLGGTIGVNSSDCSPTFTVSMTSHTGGNTFPQVGTSGLSSWDFGGFMEGTGAPRWNITTGTGQGANGVKVSRADPVVKYRIGIFRTGTDESSFFAPIPNIQGQTWDFNWSPQCNGSLAGTTQYPNPYAWRTVSIPMHLWDNVFIRIEPDASDGYLVVDKPAIDGWQGRTDRKSTRLNSSH